MTTSRILPALALCVLAGCTMGPDFRAPDAPGVATYTAGPQPGLITCPTAATCYVEGDTATSPSGPADMNSFYVSTDGAQNWSVLPVPTRVTFTSGLGCASRETCAAGGLFFGSQPI